MPDQASEERKDVMQALNEAGKEYEDYQALGELNELDKSEDTKLSYNWSWSRSLTLKIDNRKNAVVE